MVKTPGEMQKLQADAMQASSAAAMKTLEGFQRLAEVNLQAAKAAMDGSTDQIRALLAAKDVNTLTNLVSSFAQPPAEQFTAYAKAVYAIASETNADLTKMVQQEIAKGNKQLAASIEELAKNAPAGSENMVALVKSAVAAANNAVETVQKAAKQAAEVAEANQADVDKAVIAARTAYDKYWKNMPAKDRGKYIFRIARMIQERAREFAVIESLDGGKPIRESRNVDVPIAANHFFYYAGWADKLEYAFPNRKQKLKMAVIGG